MKQGEEVKGKFSLRQNATNKRLLDFAIELELYGFYMQFHEKQFFVMR